MRKIFILFAVVGMAFSSCTGPEGPPGFDGQDGQDGLTPEAFEMRNVNLGRVTDDEYNIISTFNFEIGGNLFDDETILVYRKTGTTSSGAPIWQLIPRTIYLTNGEELDYDYDFSKVDFIITARGTYNLLNTPAYINNQTFRIVIIPSNLALSVNKSNYNEVMSTLNLKESQVKKIQF